MHVTLVLLLLKDHHIMIIIMRIILIMIHTLKIGFYIVNFFLLFLNKIRRTPLLVTTVWLTLM